MTHEKFIESLNLYLDGELPPADAAALEREIAGNLERRRIYRQYCQMQNACGQLAERFREEAAPAPHFRKGAVVELPRRASGDWFRSIALVGSGAVAACAAFIAVRQFSGAPTASTVAQSPQPAAVASAQSVPATTTVAFTGNPVGFKNPWAAANRNVVDFSKLTVANTPLMLPPPDLKMPPGAENLQPYGTAPGAPLRMEEIEAAAFQFPRQ